MGKRLTRIYTRTGDAGTTGLVGDLRLGKDAARIACIGSVDELNAHLGLLRAAAPGPALDRELEHIQHRLFDLGGELAMPGTSMIQDAHVATLEQWLDAHNAGLPPLDEFVLPGGNEGAARCHVARTVCRRAERDLVRLAGEDAINGASLRYLNRLSDLLFVIARVLARRDGGIEVTWQHGV